MDVALIEEKIAHMETRRALWQAQGQLLSILAERSQMEMAGLQGQLQTARAAALVAEKKEPTP